MTFDALSSSTSDTFSHTVGSGAKGVLFLFQKCFTSEQGSISATYAGSAMTAIDFGDVGNATGLKTFYLLNPATGTNDVVVTGSSGHQTIAVSYLGARQATVPDTTDTDGAAATATSRTVSITSVTSNAWKIMGIVTGASVTFTAGAGTTLRSSGASGQVLAVLDSGGPLLVGASDLVVNFSNALNVATGFAFAPTAISGQMLAVF